MTSTFGDISETIDPDLRDLLIAVVGAAETQGPGLFVVGASARDLMFRHIFGLPVLRATRDVDVGVCVSSWGDFESLTAALTTTGRFVENTQTAHRFRFCAGGVVDVIPFGDLESPSGQIQWPPPSDRVMRTLGFPEAFESAAQIRISAAADCVVRVATPAALAVLKLIAWADRYPERVADAYDFHFIITNYGVVVDHELLVESWPQSDMDGFDYGAAAARLLGKHIRRVCAPPTAAVIAGTLSWETSAGVESRLLADMTRDEFDRERVSEQARVLLMEVSRGFNAEASAGNRQ